MINRGALFAQAVRGPVLLITVGILFALQQSGVLAFSRSWPLLIIAVGVMKLIERLLLGNNAYPLPPSMPPGSGPRAGFPPFPAQPPAGSPPPGAPPR